MKLCTTSKSSLGTQNLNTSISRRGSARIGCEGKRLRTPKATTRNPECCCGRSQVACWINGVFAQLGAHSGVRQGPMLVCCGWSARPRKEAGSWLCASCASAFHPHFEAFFGSFSRSMVQSIQHTSRQLIWQPSLTSHPSFLCGPYRC